VDVHIQQILERHRSRLGLMEGAPIVDRASPQRVAV
jgi:hypothetical protein